MHIKFIPHKLNQCLEEIKKVHQATNTIADFNNKDFVALLKQWAYRDFDDIEILAPTIQKRRIRQLFEYLPKNNLDLPTRNLYHIAELRMDATLLDRLFLLWQYNYANSDLRGFLLHLIKQNNTCLNEILKGYMLTKSILTIWLDNLFIPGAVGLTALQIKHSNNFTFESALSRLKVSIDSKLGKECKESFYTYCDRLDYIEVGDNELSNVLKNYDTKLLHLFLHNFVAKLNVEDFQRFYLTGVYLKNNYLGDSDSNRFSTFLSGYQNWELDRIRRWLAYIFIRANINDERLNFWNNYVANWLTGYEYCKSSECVIFKFKSYCILEFTRATLGPLYIYENNDFQQRIRPNALTLNNKDLRTFLYRNPRIKRIEHQSSWQSKTDSFIRSNNIMYK